MGSESNNREEHFLNTTDEKRIIETCSRILNFCSEDLEAVKNLKHFNGLKKEESKESNKGKVELKIFDVGDISKKIEVLVYTGNSIFYKEYFGWEAPMGKGKIWKMIYETMNGITFEGIEEDFVFDNFVLYILNSFDSLLKTGIKEQNKKREENMGSDYTKKGLVQILKEAREKIEEQNLLIEQVEEAQREMKKEVEGTVEFFLEDCGFITEEQYEQERLLDLILETCKEVTSKAKYALRLKNEGKNKPAPYVQDEMILGPVRIVHIINDNYQNNKINVYIEDGFKIRETLNPGTFGGYVKLAYGEFDVDWELTFVYGTGKDTVQAYGLHKEDLEFLKLILKEVKEKLVTVERYISYWEYEG